MTPKVFIVTWCRLAEQLYGSLLTFQTLRIGFPDAEVVVIENASPAELRAPIVEAAGAAGCRLELLDKEALHATLMEEVVMRESGPVVFVDPDVVFWEKVQDWEFGDALMAGRHLPEFDDPYSRMLTFSRLHTSHLWFPDPARLRARMEEIRAWRWEVGSFFEPSMRPPGWWRWDTAAVLFHALADEAHRFTEAELDAYDHLFCGSHLGVVVANLDPGSAALMSASHQRAQEDLAGIRGIWRQQEVFFASRPWSARPEG